MIGGIAAIMHGVPRATFDLDILIDATRENAAALIEALVEAEVRTILLTDVDGLLSNEITILNDRIRLDIQTRTPGLLFELAWEHRVTQSVGNQTAYLASINDMIASKLASGRPKDIEDVRALRAISERPNR